MEWYISTTMTELGLFSHGVVQPPGDPCQPVAARDELARVLSSNAFQRARRLSRFLEFVVEESLQGRSAGVKESLIGIRVYGKSDDYDPKLDCTVRTEAAKLRTRLREYYAGEGCNNPLVISIPKGGYVPQFEPRTMPEAALPAPVAPRRRWSSWAVTAGVALASLVTGVAFSGRTITPRGAPHATFTQATQGPGPESFPSLSQDGAVLVYASRASGKSDILLQSGEGNSVNLTAGSPFDSDQPALSPDGRLIAFRSERSDGGLFVMDVSGRDIRQITDFGYHPAWSPDGREIAFSTRSAADPAVRGWRDSQLWTVDVAGGAKRQITRPERVTDAVQPAWSPHRRRIAYCEISDGNSNIWTLETNEQHPVSAIRESALAWSPAWSADGHYLYFASNRGGSMNLWRVPVDEASGGVIGEPEPITSPANYAGPVSISGDGTTLAYAQSFTTRNIYKLPFDPVAGRAGPDASPVTRGFRQVAGFGILPDRDGLWFREAGHPGLYETRTGSDLRTVTAVPGSGRDLNVKLPPFDGGGLAFRPGSWSPDGRTLAGWLVRRADEDAGIATYTPASGKYNQLTDSGSHPVWLSDGRRILFRSGSVVEMLDSDSGSVREVFSAFPDTIADLVLSKDNQWLYFTRVVSAGDIWLAKLGADH